MDIDTHPNPTPNPHHRKIDLQSPADLLFLQRNLSHAATQKLDLHFPPKHAYATHIPLDGQAAQDEPAEAFTQQDPMRARVEDLVHEFMRKTWDGAKHSVSVNGMDATGVPDHFAPSAAETTQAGQKTEMEGVDFTYEAYDPRLSSKVASLYAEVEALTSQVSNLRRTNPKVGAESYTSALHEAMERDQTVYDAQREDAQRSPEEDLLKVDSIPEDTPEMYERGLAGLAALSGLKSSTAAAEKKSSLTETVGKVQRARRVVAELE